MAIGLASFHVDADDLRLVYSNLWLPTRFDKLYSYLAGLVLSAVLYAVGWRQRKKSNSRSRPGSRRPSGAKNV